MRRLGKILHLSKSRSLIVKLESTMIPNLGANVFDSKLKQIGVVHDIFGPSSAPYVAIKPSVSNPLDYVGKVAYTS